MAARPDIAPPFTDRELARLRLGLRRQVPSVGLGAHFHRRMGQSLEFRDYRDYSLGDDIRKVDWMASLRRGGYGQRVVRAFEAEERRALAVVIDCRPAMFLPDGAEKIRIALWVATCLIHAALAERDRVVVTPLFAPPGLAPVEVSAAGGLRSWRALAEGILGRDLSEPAWASPPAAAVPPLLDSLRPASAVALLTDALFDDPDGAVTRFVLQAQRNYRTLSVVEIDSWPVERALLMAGPFRLRPLEGRVFGDVMAEAGTPLLERTERAMDDHRHALRLAWRGPGLIWPDEPLRFPPRADFRGDAVRRWFRSAFPACQALPGLLARVA